MKILVTGGAGFIGSALIKHLIDDTQHQVLNVDKLTYAGNLESLAGISDNSRYQFAQIDIGDCAQLREVFIGFQPDKVIHLAAESHVDRSIDSPADFIQTNIVGTSNLLNIALEYWQSCHEQQKQDFRFIHISTDEVYGDLTPELPPTTEQTTYCPSSPYSASKAGGDHLVRAWHRTYGLPVILTHCSNNYGPRQYPEKLIPSMLFKALQGKPLTVYGDGLQIRDWISVEDHVDALMQILDRGHTGHSYNIGGNNQITNIEVINGICAYLEVLWHRDVIKKPKGIAYFRDLIAYVEDRAGHDRRYALNTNKIKQHIDWQPTTDFDHGLKQTIDWYIDNLNWYDAVISKSAS